MHSQKWTGQLFLLLMLGSGLAHAQICHPESIPSSTPDSQLQDNGNGTISDTKTGLMWKQCVEGQSGSDCGSGSAESFTWRQALLWAKTVNSSGGFAKFTDWRLPNIKELHSLVENQCSSPAINLTRFPNTTTDLVLSSTPVINVFFHVWDGVMSVGFDRGSDEFTIGGRTGHLRLVRNDNGTLAGWTFNSETGHHYKRVSCGTWKECESKAVAEGAHLVTINSAEENAWLIQTFGSDYLWIGFTDENSEGNWHWVSGEAVTYTNWADGEPNNLYIENQSHFTDNGKWNDLDGDRTEYTTDAIWEKN